MFPQRYFSDRMYAARFWPKVGSAAAPVVGPTQLTTTLAQRGPDAGTLAQNAPGLGTLTQRGPSNGTIGAA